MKIAIALGAEIPHIFFIERNKEAREVANSKTIIQVQCSNVIKV